MRGCKKQNKNENVSAHFENGGRWNNKWDVKCCNTSLLSLYSVATQSSYDGAGTRLADMVIFMLRYATSAGGHDT